MQLLLVAVGFKFEKVGSTHTSMLGLLLLQLLGVAAENSAGMQLFRNDSVLLVQARHSRKWGFPKGVQELTDRSLHETALRETYEETGYKKYTDYILCDEIPRRFGGRPYWSAVVITDTPPRLSIEEHRAIRWVPIHMLDTLRLTRDVDEWYTLDRQVPCDFMTVKI
jgi:8-oxo-dGTP pyrophosphatase MutT (NUDIX family)